MKISKYYRAFLRTALNSENKKRLYAVVVLYNKKIQDSITISHLMKLQEEYLHIIVLDNSTDAFVTENKMYFSEDLLTYYNMGGNVGLSKAYNYALSKLKNKPENDIVIWFDDDTPVKKEYFSCLKKNAEDKMYDVFVPVIYGQNGVIYSPNEIGWLKGKYISSPEQKIPQNKFNAINSCLAVRLKAYKDYVYDEGLFMDCVDTKLFDDFRSIGYVFKFELEIHCIILASTGLKKKWVDIFELLDGA